MAIPFVLIRQPGIGKAAGRWAVFHEVCKTSTLRPHDTLSLGTQWDLRSPTLMTRMTSGDCEGFSCLPSNGLSAPRVSRVEIPASRVHPPPSQRPNLDRGKLALWGEMH